MIKAITQNPTEWRSWLSRFSRVDVCHLPEYHAAYATRVPHSTPLLWTFEAGGHSFANPIFLSDIVIDTPAKSAATGFRDVSSVYGFSGPLATTLSREFLDEAWKNFDAWANEQKVISEFVRFSVYCDNSSLAHSKCEVSANRPLSVSQLPVESSEYIRLLPSKTRNMISRAQREGLVVRRIPLEDGLAEFRNLYTSTMQRNQAVNFFSYDDSYFSHLLSLNAEERVLHAVYQGERMVAGVIGLIHGEYAFYHLGANDPVASRLGSGNLALHNFATSLIENGVKFLNVGGGRSPQEDDPLFVFKKNNGTETRTFYIGKRVLNVSAYADVVEQWRKLTGLDPDLSQLQFYRR